MPKQTSPLALEKSLLCLPTLSSYHMLAGPSFCTTTFSRMFCLQLCQPISKDNLSSLVKEMDKIRYSGIVKLTKHDDLLASLSFLF